MAETKGITIKFSGDDAEFQAAVKNVNNELRATKSEITTLNKQLKLDPTNVDKLREKFSKLKDLQKELTEKVSIFEQKLQNVERGSKEWQKINAELQRAKVDLESINQELAKMPTANIQALSNWLEDIGGKLDKAGKSIENLGKKISVLSAGIIGIGTAGVKFNAQLEQYQTAFTTLIGDADAAAQAIKNIQEDASKSPFSTESLIEANQYLIAAGVSAEESRETIMALGEAIAATGGGSNELSRMAQNLQQIKNLGKASSVDIKQFANAGINIYGLLADTTGKTVDQLKKMDISYEVLDKALKKAASEGGKYFGAMEKQSETLSGSISVLKDSFNQLLGELTQSLVPIVKDVIAFINQIIAYIKELSPEQKDMAVRIAEIIAILGPGLVVIGKIVSTVGGLVTKLGSLLPMLSRIINPFTAIIAALVVLYAKNEDFRNSVNNLASTIWSVLKPALENLWGIIQTVWQILGYLVDKAKELWDWFSKTTAFSVFIAGLNGVVETVKVAIQIVGGLISVVKDAFNWFGKLIGIQNESNSIARPRNYVNQLSSGGYGNMMSGGISIQNSFTINGVEQLSNARLIEVADIITDRVNENLGVAV